MVNYLKQNKTVPECFKNETKQDRPQMFQKNLEFLGKCGKIIGE